MNIQNLLGQLQMSNNPMSMIMGMLPNQNQKTVFSSLANSKTDEERAQRIADICNDNGITKSQLEDALKAQRRL